MLSTAALRADDPELTAESIGMSTFVMMSRLSPEAACSPRAILVLERKAMELIRLCCPGVTWRASYALLGSHDYCDIFDAPNINVAMQVSMLMRTSSNAITEIWAAAAWPHFKASVQQLASAVERRDAAMEFDETDDDLKSACDALEIEQSLKGLDSQVALSIMELEPSFMDLEMSLAAYAKNAATQRIDFQHMTKKARCILDILLAADRADEENVPPQN
jgi:hypothetical protein